VTCKPQYGGHEVVLERVGALEQAVQQADLTVLPAALLWRQQHEQKFQEAAARVWIAKVGGGIGGDDGEIDDVVEVLPGQGSECGNVDRRDEFQQVLHRVRDEFGHGRKQRCGRQLQRQQRV